MKQLKQLSLSLFIVLMSSICAAQNSNWRIGLGAGIPDFPHIAVGYDASPRSLVILSGSYFNTPSSKFRVVTLRHNYFFNFSRGSEKLSKWYFGQKINYLYEDQSRGLSGLTEHRSKNLLMGLDLGRQFHISSRFTANFDMGIGFNVFNDTEFRDRDGNNFDFGETPVAFTFNLTFFYRI